MLDAVIGRIVRSWGGFRAYCARCSWSSDLLASERIAGGVLQGHGWKSHPRSDDEQEKPK